MSRQEKFYQAELARYMEEMQQKELINSTLHKEIDQLNIRLGNATGELSTFKSQASDLKAIIQEKLIHTIK